MLDLNPHKQKKLKIPYLSKTKYTFSRTMAFFLCQPNQLQPKLSSNHEK